jgi:hypothetical protein
MGLPRGSGCWLAGHTVAWSRWPARGTPERRTAAGSAGGMKGNAALGSSNVLAGKEPASPALGSLRPQRCPDPLPASVLVHAA